MLASSIDFPILSMLVVGVAIFFYFRKIKWL